MSPIMQKRLREELPEDIVIGVLHGQMKAEQKIRTRMYMNKNLKAGK